MSLDLNAMRSVNIEEEETLKEILVTFGAAYRTVPWKEARVKWR